MISSPAGRRPPETGSGGTAGGSAPFELEVASGGTWVRVAVTDDDAIFDEFETGQSGAGGGDQQVLAKDVTIGGVTCTAGMRIVSAYDLINSSTGHKHSYRNGCGWLYNRGCGRGGEHRTA